MILCSLIEAWLYDESGCVIKVENSWRLSWSCHQCRASSHFGSCLRLRSLYFPVRLASRFVACVVDPMYVVVVLHFALDLQKGGMGIYTTLWAL